MNSAARVQTDPRITRRRRAVERSKRKRLMLRGAIALTVVCGIWTAFWSPLLEIDAVRVVGSKHVTSADVAAAAQLDSDDNLLLLSTGDVEAAVEELPWVRSAEVDRKLPGTVKVRIVERTPAMILSADGRQWTIDSSGHVLTAGRASKGLPVLGAVVVGEVAPGSVLSDDSVVAGLRTWRSLSPSLRRRVEGIFAPTTQRLTLALSGGVLVRYGAAEQFRAKNAVLKAVLARVTGEGRKIEYIDVRVPTSPAVQPVVAPVAPPVVSPPSPTSSPTPTPSSSRTPDDSDAEKDSNRND